MKKKMTSLLALFCMMFCAGASAQSAYQKAYDKAKSKSLVNALSFSLEKDKERLRKAAYKYREDIPKEVLKMAKKDNAILHGTWIQGQTKSWDLFGKPLPIPEAYVPLCRYNDSVFAIRNMMMETQPIQLYNVNRGVINVLAYSLDGIVYQPFLNSALSNIKESFGYSNVLASLDDKYFFSVIDINALNSLQVADLCRKDSAKAESMEYADYMDLWKHYYYTSKVSDDRELYKDNVWMQDAERYYALGEYRKALHCIEQFMAFDIDGMNDRNGMFAYELKYMQLKCYRELKKYNDVLAAMDYLKRADYLADGMYFSPQSKSIVVCAGVSEDVETNFKSKMLTLCKECQTLQEERERNNAIFAAALLGALGTTVSNITGSSNQSSGAAYSGGGGAASSASTAAAGSSASTKTATRCTACNGKGVCQSCKNHPGKATSNSKDRTPCKVCGGKITCQYCGGSGFKKL